MTIKIESYEELLDYAEKCMLSATAIEPIDIGNALDYKIKLTGDKWDGSIDYRLAQYIVLAQKTLDKLVDELGLNLAEEDKPVIKFKVNEGCLEVIIKFSEAAKALFENMSSREKIYTATLLIIAIVGGFSGHEYHEYKDRQEARVHELKMQELEDNKELKQQEKLVNVINTLAEKIPVYQAPTKKLANIMSPGDTINSSIDNITRTKDELKKQFPTKGKYKPDLVYIDGEYTITTIKLESGSITVEQGPYRYDCQSSLNDQELESLFSRVKAAYAEGKGFKLNLKVTAKYFKGSNTLKNLVIYEIGEPREGSCTIESLIESKSEI